MLRQQHTNQAEKTESQHDPVTFTHVCNNLDEGYQQVLYRIWFAYHKRLKNILEED